MLVDAVLGDGHAVTSGEVLAAGSDAVGHVHPGLVVVVGVEGHRGEGGAVKLDVQGDVARGTVRSVVRGVNPLLAHVDGGRIYGHGVGLVERGDARIGLGTGVHPVRIGIGDAIVGPGAVIVLHRTIRQHLGRRGARLRICHARGGVGLDAIGTSARVVDDVLGQTGCGAAVLQLGNLVYGFLARPHPKAHGVGDAMLEGAK